MDMAGGLTLLLGVLVGLLCLPVLVLFVQVLLACLPWRCVAKTAAETPVGARPRIAVLVPAHDEAAVIAATLTTLRPQLQAGDRLLVVADNCSDETAALARAAGAEVIERTNREQRGKGYALDFGVRYLAADVSGASQPPEVLIIVDADCQVAAGSLDVLAQKSALTGRPVQALYLMHAPMGAGLKLRIAAFAWLVKNQLRPLGFLRLGLPCQLMGTGMAFPWPMAVQMPLANANIVEDMKLGIELALAGTPPLFCPEARVSSEFPLTAAAVSSQRTRWEHGHLGMMLHEGPRLLGRAFGAGDVGALGLALDLLVPPLALLVLLLLGVLVLAALAAVCGAAWWPFWLALAGNALLFAAVGLAWLGWGRRVVSLRDLATAPWYVLAKIPLYLNFWTRRQKDWVRTERKGD